MTPRWVALVAVSIGCSAPSQPVPEPAPEPAVSRADAGLPPCGPDGVRVHDKGACVSRRDRFMRLYQDGQDAFNLGNFREAIDAFLEASELEPQMPGPWRMLAAMYEKTGEYAKCLAAANRYLEIATDPSRRRLVAELRTRCGVKQSSPKPPLPQQEPQ